jgi:hypothetical protein
MRRGEDCILRPTATPWTPPIDYQYVARSIQPEMREHFISKCEEWFEANLPRQTADQVEKHVVDDGIVLALFQKYRGQVPPLDERIRVYKAAGYTKEYLLKVMNRHAHLEETSDERQKALDGIFAKWPSANKTLPKKAKVIKAVVKKRT